MRLAVFKRISVRFCGFRTPLTPPSNLSNTRDSVLSGYPNTKRVENTTRSGVFLTKFEVFG